MKNKDKKVIRISYTKLHDIGLDTHILWAGSFKIRCPIIMSNQNNVYIMCISLYQIINLVYENYICITSYNILVILYNILQTCNLVI